MRFMISLQKACLPKERVKPKMNITVEPQNKIVIIGAGISGLTIAYLLNKLGHDIAVLEKKKEPGGSIETVIEKEFLFDKGPNSALETHPLIGQLIEERCLVLCQTKILFQLQF